MNALLEKRLNSLVKEARYNGKLEVITHLIKIYQDKTKYLEENSIDISIARANINKIKMECYLELITTLANLRIN